MFYLFIMSYSIFFSSVTIRGQLRITIDSEYTINSKYTINSEHTLNSASDSHELILLSTVMIPHSAKLFCKLICTYIIGSSQFLQTMIIITKLCIHKTKQHYRILWYIHCLSPLYSDYSSSNFTSTKLLSSKFTSQTIALHTLLLQTVLHKQSNIVPLPCTSI